MRTIRVLLLLGALLTAGPTLAQVAGTVEGVQMPAWVERAGKRLPAMAGMELRAGDNVVTGPGSRMLVKLAEGSLVKLGENGQLRFAEVSPQADLFRAALNVLEGAFRFTTDALAKTTRRREVSIRVAQVTAGIRGTDLWGRSRKDNEIVCLIEGAIEVGAEGEQAVQMNVPLQFYRRIDAKTQPIGTVEVKQLAQWAAETEIAEGKGAARAGGKFSIEVGSFGEQNGALALYDELRAAGYAAELRPVKDADRMVYLVRIRHLPSRAEAQALANSLKGKFGIGEPKISG